MIYIKAVHKTKYRKKHGFHTTSCIYRHTRTWNGAIIYILDRRQIQRYIIIYKKHLSLHSKHGLIAQFCIRHFVVSQCLLILQHNFFHCTLNMTLKNQVKKRDYNKAAHKMSSWEKKIDKIKVFFRFIRESVLRIKVLWSSCRPGI